MAKELSPSQAVATHPTWRSVPIVISPSSISSAIWGLERRNEAFNQLHRQFPFLRLFGLFARGRLDYARKTVAGMGESVRCVRLFPRLPLKLTIVFIKCPPFY